MEKNEALTKPKENLQNLSDYLEKKKDMLGAVLPKHLTPDRLTKIACAAVSRNANLMQCTIPSLYLSITQAASLGLEPGLDCHLVPYWSGKNKRYECQMIADYKGLIGLALRSDKVTKIFAHEVRENDEFTFELGIDPKITHRPNLNSDRGELTHAYAVAKLSNGESQFALLGKKEIAKIRASSKAKGGGPWKDWEEEMWKKSAVRQLSKYLPKSTEFRQALQLENCAESGERPSVGIAAERVFAADITVLDDANIGIPKEGKRLQRHQPAEKKEEEKKDFAAKIDAEGVKTHLDGGAYSIKVTGKVRDNAVAIGNVPGGVWDELNFFWIFSGLTMAEAKTKTELLEKISPDLIVTVMEAK